MAHWSIVINEPELRKCCRTDMLGTTAHDAAECAQRYGFHAKALRNAHWNDLVSWYASGLYPILFVNLFPLDTLWVYHAVVIETFEENSVSYIDPTRGRRSATVEAFEQAWQMNKGQAVIISPSPF